jgi:type IV secretory pathway VirB6-like protein
VTLLVIIAPLFLPLVLLQATMPYFDKWWRGILASMLLPLATSAYFVIAMLIYDEMLFKPDSLVQKLFDTDFMKKAQVENQEYCATGMVQDQAFSEKGSGMENKQRLTDANVFNAVRPLLTGSSMACFSRPTLQVSPEEMEKLFIQLAQLLTLSILAQKGFESLRRIVSNFGSGMVSATMDPVSAQEQRISAAFDRARQDAMNAATSSGGKFSEASGTEFIRTVPGAMGAAVRGFMETIGDSKIR